MKKRVIVSILVYLSFAFGANDWLINPEKFESKIMKSKGFIELNNGLVSRKIKLTPNAATVSFYNIQNEEEFIRSVRPEAEIIIDGNVFNIGGLSGQPVHNYITEAQIKKLENMPNSFQYFDYEIGEIEARLPWKKREEWLSTDAQWPPKGKHLILKFHAKDELLKSIISNNSSDENRKLIFEDKFIDLDKGWQLYASHANERNSFVNEGKVGEIMALAHNSVYAERKFPSDAKVIITKINPGTDKASAWGPGLTLVTDIKFLKFNLRPAENKLGLYDGEEEQLISNLDLSKSCWLKMFIKPDKIICSYSYDGKQWKKAGNLKYNSQNKIKKIRVGKTGWNGDNSDHPSMGKRGRCKIDYFALFGDVKNNKSQNQMNELAYLKDLEINVHYNIYDGIPLISKWFTLENNSNKDIRINKFKSEILATVEAESPVGVPLVWKNTNLDVETDYAFDGGMSATSSLGKSVFWNADPLYATQVNYDRKTPCLLECYPQYGPNVIIESGSEFASFRSFELLHNDTDRERRGLARRKMYRTIAPWTQENPILMHVRSADNESVKLAIDQCAAVGFEMVILTFGSGFNIEDDSKKNLNRLKKLADYAHSKGIAIGGYSLLASRKVGGGNDVVMPEGMKPRFNNSPCLESEWGHEYFRKLYNFYKKTGMDILEHDGSYPGDICMSTDHPGHHGLNDSQWKQFERIRKFYHWCRGNGIYLNVPDWYFLNGSSKTGMGYRETNWSLPRKQQEIIERQNIYDGTWEKTPSMGWMFVPLTQYHGGGDAATIEPLKDHLPHYNQRLTNLFGAGVQACYRGPRLYDSPETKAIVKNWVDFYKKHRSILDSDIIHVKRPDGRHLDCILHVNPKLEEKGLAMIYNPLNKKVEKVLTLPLYYTGLTDEAEIINRKGKSEKYKMNRAFEVQVKVEIEPFGYECLIIK